MKLFSFTATKNRVSIFIVIVLTIYIWLIAGWNYYNSDYENYRRYYDVLMLDRLAFGGLDFGYHYLSYLFYLLGCEFNDFRIFIYGLSLFFISYYCLKWSKVPVFCLLFYIAFHFLRDVVQTRNFIASVFILFAVECMLYTGLRYRILLFILIAISFSIHMSFVVYFLFCFPDLFKKLSYFRFLFICILFSFIANSLVSYFAFIFNSGLLSDKVAEYLSYSPVWSIVLSSCLAIMNGFVLKYYFYRVREKNIVDYCIHSISLSRFMDVIMIINIVSCVFVMFSSVNFSFYGRLFGNLLLVNIVCITNIIYILKSKRNFIDCLVLLIYIVVFVCFLQITPFVMHYNDVVSNNYIL